MKLGKIQPPAYRGARGEWGTSRYLLSNWLADCLDPRSKERHSAIDSNYPDVKCTLEYGS